VVGEIDVQAIREEANRDAQRAFKRMLEVRDRTGAWDPRLWREYQEAEDVVSDIDALYALPEAYLDALFDATQGELEDLRVLDPQWLPDIPLAVVPMDWTPVEDVTPQLMAYWNRGA
jgi:hypothetical protein